jgi:hypothetical protein
MVFQNLGQSGVNLLRDELAKRLSQKRLLGELDGRAI